jgi:hypothetical protein
MVEICGLHCWRAHTNRECVCLNYVFSLLDPSRLILYVENHELAIFPTISLAFR